MSPDELKIASSLRRFSLILEVSWLGFTNRKAWAEDQRKLVLYHKISQFFNSFCSSESCRNQTGSRCDRILMTSLAMFISESPLTKWELASSLYLCLRYLCNMFRWRSWSLAALALSLTSTRSVMRMLNCLTWIIESYPILDLLFEKIRNLNC